MLFRSAARLLLWASDCNGNGVPDRCDIDLGTASDVNGDGVPDLTLKFLEVPHALTYDALHGDFVVS